MGRSTRHWLPLPSSPLRIDSPLNFRSSAMVNPTTNTSMSMSPTSTLYLKIQLFYHPCPLILVQASERQARIPHACLDFQTSLRHQLYFRLRIYHSILVIKTSTSARAWNVSLVWLPSADPKMIIALAKHCNIALVLRILLIFVHLFYTFSFLSHVFFDHFAHS